MDSFLQSLLCEHLTTNCSSDSDSGSATECLVEVVDDNARFHSSSWKEIPLSLRDRLTLEGDVPNTPPLRRRPQQPAHCQLENPCSTRWGSAVPKKQQATSEPVPAPPACPQRQRSIEVTPQNWASIKSNSSVVLEPLAEEVPRKPQRQASVCMESLPSSALAQLESSAAAAAAAEELPRKPQRQASVALDGSYTNSPSSVADCFDGQMPRKPQRQASLAVDTTSLPLPPMTATVVAPPRSKSADDLAIISKFSKNVKRSSASLLDDDDSDDEEEDSRRRVQVKKMQSLWSVAA